MVLADATILTHLRRGALEYCVLAVVADRPRYGLEIARELGETLIQGEGTLYPLLGRLRRGGLVETTWQESTEGPPRRYYALTGDGKEALATFVRTWAPFSAAVESALDQAGGRS